ncbi:hypothetical protein EVAR_18654_1 [Eumeta japonica]|uniref:Uncharacterized protein n=1 Tax=Eumeta variegata TaxID=151549 RepID=A0A4C1U6K9_EUMVA|nr:hypothetical protein EVAR_18654_1 [Eumeta japonica]
MAELLGAGRKPVLTVLQKLPNPSYSKIQRLKCESGVQRYPATRGSMFRKGFCIVDCFNTFREIVKNIKASRSGNRQATSHVQLITAREERFSRGEHELDVAGWNGLPLVGLKTS